MNVLSKGSAPELTVTFVTSYDGLTYGGYL